MTRRLPVSVVIPCHNRADLLPRAIESVLAQTALPEEVIVVDDQSTDASVEVARRYPVTVVTVPGVRGAPATRNRGIAVATGTYYACLDSDDWWEPEHLEIVVGLLEQYPEAVAGGAVVRLAGAWPGGEREGAQRIPADRPVDAFLQAFEACPIPHQTLVCRLDALRRAGRYGESFRSADDFELYLRLARLGPFVRSSRITANYWAHEGQLTGSQAGVLRDRHVSRREAVARLRAEGETGLADRLLRRAEDLWSQEMRWVWSRGDRPAADELVRLAALPPTVPMVRRLLWRALWTAAPLVRRPDGSSRGSRVVGSVVRRLQRRGVTPPGAAS